MGWTKMICHPRVGLRIARNFSQPDGGRTGTGKIIRTFLRPGGYLSFSMTNCNRRGPRHSGWSPSPDTRASSGTCPKWLRSRFPRPSA